MNLLTNQEELDALFLQADDDVVDWKLSREFAKIEMTDLIGNGEFPQNSSLWEISIPVYDSDGEIRYYEFRVVSDEKTVGAIVGNAHEKQENPIAFVTFENGYADELDEIKGNFSIQCPDEFTKRVLLTLYFYANGLLRSFVFFPYFGCIKKSDALKNPDIFEFDCDLAPFVEEVWTAPLGTTNPVHCKFEKKVLKNSHGFILTITAKGKKVFEGIAWIPDVTEDFRIWSNSTRTWNEPIEITSGGTIRNNPTWFVNNIEQPSHERVFVLPAQGECECVNVVRAEMTVDGETFRSNEITIFNTQKSDSESLEKLAKLSKIATDFVAQNDIKTAISVAVKSPDIDFAFNAGKTSLSTDDACTVNTLHFFYSIVVLSRTATATVSSLLRLKNTARKNQN